MLHVLISLDVTSSEEKNDTKIIKFGWVDLIPWLYFET